MLNQRIDHPLSNQRDNIFIQFHRLFNMGAQLRVARWRFANNHPTHLIVVIINDVCFPVSEPEHLEANVAFETLMKLTFKPHLRTH
jgi:hypothetical protein